jgi:hypothetical protein
MKRLPRLFTAVALGSGCSAPMLAPDSGVDDAGHEGLDAGADAGHFDAGYDAGVPDAGAPDAGASDAGPSDAGTPDAGTPNYDGGTPWGDAGCVLPSDFPWDAGFADAIADEACQCVWIPAVHCFVENGPRCFSWACPPAASPDGGYVYMDDGGLECLC